MVQSVLLGQTGACPPSSNSILIIIFITLVFDFFQSGDRGRRMGLVIVKLSSQLSRGESQGVNANSQRLSCHQCCHCHQQHHCHQPSMSPKVINNVIIIITVTMGRGLTVNVNFLVISSITGISINSHQKPSTMSHSSLTWGRCESQKSLSFLSSPVKVISASQG